MFMRAGGTAFFTNTYEYSATNVFEQILQQPLALLEDGHMLTNRGTAFADAIHDHMRPQWFNSKRLSDIRLPTTPT